jgi:hypothetical protein
VGGSVAHAEYDDRSLINAKGDEFIRTFQEFLKRKNCRKKDIDIHRRVYNS